MRMEEPSIWQNTNKKKKPKGMDKRNDGFIRSTDDFMLWTFLADFNPQVLDIQNCQGKKPVF